ncbi:glycosyltransferase [Fodinicurvata sediminis]|uniref:glycosyltransferase n=1 Tax=Fodinicurvata sediminis TaxID=1121832 RepID=UPI0003B44CE2|nr:glycosyltransferase [Fodinicurvata sediminis]
MDPFLSYDLYFTAQAWILALFVLAALIQLISAIDDLMMDLMALACKAGLKPAENCRRYNLHKLLSQSTSEKPLAIMMPAWKEAPVIRKSVTRLLSVVSYRNYKIFIGCYPNDSDTVSEAIDLAETYPNVEMILLPHDGGTNKADCLNHIYSAIKSRATVVEQPFEAFILQDAEDVVHPYAFRVCNYFLDQYDVVQLPVVALPRSWFDLTTGHYQDEFAEMHAKELVARAAFSGLVPGAGVGTAYAAATLSRLGDEVDIFRNGALTEDYDLSFRLHQAGARFCFPRVYDRQRKGIGTRHDLVATREYFPDSFYRAVRQKSRWTIGIGLQGWSQLGWTGSFWLRHQLWRDRKALLCAHAAPASYAALLLLLWQKHMETQLGYTPHAFLPSSQFIWILLLSNLGLMIYRLVLRGYWTWSLYGWGALVTLPLRYGWSVAINYSALLWANGQYWWSRLRGKPLTWVKTDHNFPDESVLKDKPPPPRPGKKQP